MRRSRDAHKWVGGPYPRCERLAVSVCLKAITQKASITLVDLLKASHRCSGIGKGLSRDAPRGSSALCGGHVVLVRFCGNNAGRLGGVYTTGMRVPTSNRTLNLPPSHCCEAQAACFPELAGSLSFMIGVPC